jgi:hypothetical protein
VSAPPGRPRRRARGADGLVSEASFQRQVEALGRFYGWRMAHAPDNRPGRNGRVQAVASGWPDLVLCRPPELLIVELKRDTTYPSPAQRAWLDDLTECGVEVYVWRPRDWPTIEARLARGRTIVPAAFDPRE